jgi:hypothetical protein
VNHVLEEAASHPWNGAPAELRPVIVLGGGAKWIWDHVATLFGGERTEIVDWYHASEHIWTVGQGTAWRRLVVCPGKIDRNEVFR